jgi:hypothetical protein
VLILGFPSYDVAAALANAIAPDTHDTVILNNALGLIVELYSGSEVEQKYITNSVATADFVSDLDTFMSNQLGHGWRATSYINQNDTTAADDDGIIVLDACDADVPVFVSRFGEGNVLVLCAGPLRAPSALAGHAGRVLWLPSLEVAENEKLLRRELGELG